MADAYRPVNLTEALEIRGRERTTVFAGGSDLMVKYRRWSGAAPQFPGPVLFISHLPELRVISRGKDVLKIGAACTISQLLADERIPVHLKLPLWEMASPSVRNIATIGGNICNASPAGDTLPMLYALDARLTLQAKNNTRTLGIAEFISGPGQTALAAGEILTEIILPSADWPNYYYKKAGARKANCISKVTVYAVARCKAGRIRDIRAAFGAVGPTVVRSTAAEALVNNSELSRIPALIETIDAHYAAALKPIDDLRSTEKYRRQTALRILRHFLLEELV